MVYKLILWLGICLLLLNVSACSTQTQDLPRIEPPVAAKAQPIAEEPEPVAEADQQFLVSLDGQKLTAQHLRWMNRRSPGQDPPATMIKRMTDYWLNTQLLYEEAERRGLTDDPQAKFLADLTRKDTYARRLIQQLRDETLVTNEQVRDYYDKNRDADQTLTHPLRFTFSHIKVRTLDNARATMKRIEQGEDFNALAKEVSVARDAGQGGTLEQLPQSLVLRQYGKELSDALLAADKGAVIRPFKQRDNTYEIARLEQRFDPQPKSFAEVKEIIETKLNRQAQTKVLEDIINSLKKKAESRIVESEQLLEPKEAAGEPAQRP